MPRARVYLVTYYDGDELSQQLLYKSEHRRGSAANMEDARTAIGKRNGYRNLWRYTVESVRLACRHDYDLCQMY